MSSPPETGDTPGHYNNSHRAFLQAFFAHSTLTFEQAKPILAAVLSAQENRTTLINDITFEDFNNYIHTLNAAIHPFDYEIRSTYPQNASTRSADTALYAIVNNASDPHTQLATTYAADEIAYINRLIDGMFETNNTPSKEIMAIKGMDAVNLRRAPRDRSSAVSALGTQATQTPQATQAMQAPTNADVRADRAEEILKMLVMEGWLQRSKAGYLSLSPRALMELRSWLVATYNEEDDEEDGGPQWQRIKFCDACKEIVTVGQRCSNRDCFCRLHDFCTAGYFRTQTERKCPSCKTNWTSDHFVGERAVRAAGLPGRASNSTSNGAGSHRRNRNSTQHAGQDESSDGE